MVVIQENKARGREDSKLRDRRLLKRGRPVLHTLPAFDLRRAYR